MRYNLHLILRRPPPFSRFWFVPSAGAGRARLHHLWYDPVHGWETPTILSYTQVYLLTQNNKPLAPDKDIYTMSCINRSTSESTVLGPTERLELNGLIRECLVSVSSGGSEWWTLQPRCRLVVAGHPALLIGYRKGDYLSLSRLNRGTNHSL